ncbi:MAG: AAA family ATPase, partial [Anaerolinea sp.]|nr:AAA family ATPase [Anaerolinea sp.]
TIATNLASGLMKKNIKVLLIDADLQFGDVGVFLKLSANTTLVEVVAKVDDLDTEFFDSLVATHESGLRVLLGPQRPELAADITDPTSVARVIEKIAASYDFIVVDTSRYFDETLISLTDMATKIVLVATPTLAHVKNARFVLDLFDKLNYPPEKIALVLNRVDDEKARNRVTVPIDTIERYLRRKVDAKLPNNEAVVLNAVNKGVPAIALARDRSKAPSPVREMIDFSEQLFSELMTDSAATTPSQAQDANANKKKSGLSLRLGRG